MKKQCLFLLVLFISLLSDAFALSYLPNNGQRGHRDDFEAVLPFVWDARLDEWGRCITGNLDRFMDNEVEEYGGLSTYQYFKIRFGIKCGAGDHRAFFHWGYQRRPWSDALLRHLPDSVKLVPERLLAFQEALRVEQARRNRLANAATEQALGFGSGGRSASYANAFIAIIYDVHLLGDYETKNAEGLAEVSAIVSEIISSLNTIDRDHAKSLAKDLNAIAKGPESQPAKAKLVLAYLRSHLPQFILSADDGFVNMKNHFEQLNFKFRSELSETPPSPMMSVMAPMLDSGEKVGVTRSGKYHKLSCGNLKKANSPSVMSIEEAKGKGAAAAKCCFK